MALAWGSWPARCCVEMDASSQPAVDRVIRTSALSNTRAGSGFGRRFVVLNAAVISGLLMLAFTVESGASSLAVGDVAGETIVAQHRVTYTDRLATQSRKQQAMAAVPTQFYFDPGPARRERAAAEHDLAAVATVLKSARTPQARAREILAVLPRSLPRETVQTFLTLTSSDMQVVQPITLNILTQALSWRYSAGDSQITAMGLLSTVPQRLAPSQRVAVSDLISTFLVPTLQPDERLTRQLQREAASRVAPVRATIAAGQVIVRRGDIVTGVRLEQLDALGLQTQRVGWHQSLGTLLYALLVVTMLLWYFAAFQPAILANRRLLLLVDASLLISAVGARVLTPGHVLLPYFLPVAGASTFAAVLIAPEAAIAIALAMALTAGWVVANSFELTVFYFLSGAAGVLAIRHATRIKQFAVAGVAIGLFAFLTIMSFALVDHTYDLAALQEYVLASTFNGSVSATFALGGFALLSAYFGVTTTLQLLELAQPNQPLLRRLMVKAPGTYNHSLIVSNMVEHAAEEVGANSLVAKVGALYHDVGKTSNPHCFVENQMGIANVHDELRAAESARIIKGHVSQGLRLARQHRLPRVILDHIAEHHGTMTLPFFLHKAKQESGDMAVNAALFTYGGPKPQTKETALLMLADGCESAVRASQDHSHTRIREIVDAIFRERIDQGQLDDCPLTIRDLELTKHAYRSVLNGLYHPRVEYPEPQALQPSLVPASPDIPDVPPALRQHSG